MRSIDHKPRMVDGHRKMMSLNSLQMVRNWLVLGYSNCGRDVGANSLQPGKVRCFGALFVTKELRGAAFVPRTYG